MFGKGKDTMADTNKTTTNKTTSAGNENIIIGDVYKAKTNEAEVIPYFLDYGAGRVNFANVGRSNEENLSTAEFLDAHEHVGPVSSRAEKQVSNETALKQNEAARKAEAEKAEAGDPTRKTGV